MRIFNIAWLYLYSKKIFVFQYFKLIKLNSFHVIWIRPHNPLKSHIKVLDRR